MFSVNKITKTGRWFFTSLFSLIHRYVFGDRIERTVEDLLFERQQDRSFAFEHADRQLVFARRHRAAIEAQRKRARFAGKPRAVICVGIEDVGIPVFAAQPDLQIELAVCAPSRGFPRPA